MKFKSIFLVTIFAFFACSETKETTLDVCNECVVIDNTLYNKTQTNNYTINHVVLNEGFLTLKISASGCSGNSWVATLVDANQILESNPIQRNIRISFQNKEACLAVFEKEFTFNIKELKQNKSEIILNLDGWNTQINYN